MRHSFMIEISNNQATFLRALFFFRLSAFFSRCFLGSCCGRTDSGRCRPEGHITYESELEVQVEVELCG
jgi:hypothetical protein